MKKMYLFGLGLLSLNLVAINSYADSAVQAFNLQNNTQKNITNAVLVTDHDIICSLSSTNNYPVKPNTNLRFVCVPPTKGTVIKGAITVTFADNTTASCPNYLWIVGNGGMSITWQTINQNSNNYGCIPSR